MFTYDDVWEEFLLNYKVEEIELPSEEEHIIKIIKTNVMKMDNRMQLDLKCDDESETIVNLKTTSHLIILATFIKLQFIENANTYAENLMQPFTQDVGIRNVNTQLASYRNSLVRVKQELDTLIFNSMEDYL